MKRFFGICLAAMLLLSGCGEASNEGTATPEPELQDASESPAEEEETPEYEDLAAPFSAVHSGADVTVRERQNRFEVYVDCADLDINTQPENWDGLCTAYETAMMESQTISDESYEGKAVSFQLRDATQAILCSGYGSGIQFNAFATPSEDPAANDPRITLGEYNQLSIGMTYSDCVEIIGGEGTLDIEVGSAGGYTGSIRNYTWQGTTDYGVATLSFDDFVLYSKFQVGLE